MKPRYEAIVIGSGFGGAIASCRLAQAGFKVGIIERGRRFGPNHEPFPRDLSQLEAWYWPLGRGLFDLKLLGKILSVQAAGYGGGSLVYANVHVRPPDSIFDHGWPAGYSRQSLDDYYSLVGYMLNVTAINAAVRGLPPKASLMRAAADGLQRGQHFFYPNLALNLGQAGDPFQQQHRAPEPCNYCGECIIGCNNKAKNTLDFNYLKAAEESGADVTTGCQVTKLERLDNGRYLVSCTDLEHDKDLTTEASYVFLCAGAVNTTELLLKCRDEFGTLPRLSPLLGHGYSANGDFLAFSYDTNQPFEPSNGPTITSALLFDREVGGDRIWFLLEDGGYPPQLASVIQLLHPAAASAKRIRNIRSVERLSRELRAAASAALANGHASAAGSDRTAVFLSMGRDRSTGTMRWLHDVKLATVHWNVESNLPLYDTEAQLSTDFAGSNGLGGKAAFNPFWELLRLPISVHNLGGCPMSDQPTTGVVDARGQVYGYPGLYVLDGSILPAATGVNPSHTIAAVAERNVEAFIRQRQPDWRAPQWDAALGARLVEPFDRIQTPKGGTPLPRTEGVRISFNERLAGNLTLIDAANARTEVPDGLTVELNITTPLLDEFVIDKRHTGVARGRLIAKGFSGAGGTAVENGIFNLFVAGREGDYYARQMLYELPFTATNTRSYVLKGHKNISDDGTFRVWSSTTTLFYELFPLPGNAKVGEGTLRIGPADVLRLLTSFDVQGTDNPLLKIWHLGRFLGLFVGTLFDLFVRPLMPGSGRSCWEFQAGRRNA
jgi:cholesterol oxidase